MTAETEKTRKVSETVVEAGEERKPVSKNDPQNPKGLAEESLQNEEANEASKWRSPDAHIKPSNNPEPVSTFSTLATLLLTGWYTAMASKVFRRRLCNSLRRRKHGVCEWDD